MGRSGWYPAALGRIRGTDTETCDRQYRFIRNRACAAAATASNRQSSCRPNSAPIPIRRIPARAARSGPSSRHRYCRFRPARWTRAYVSG